MADRVWSGSVAAALACLMLLQAVAGPLAVASMVAPGTQGVICTSTGAGAGKMPAGPDAPGRNAPLWDCATLCQLASASTPAIIGVQPGLPCAAPPPLIANRALPDLFLPSSHLEAIAGARAPPSLSA